MAERNLDFDRIVDRRGTNCLKYDFAVKRGMPEDVLPLWIADMDFQTSSYVQDALCRQAEHGIFGYGDGQEEYFGAVRDWLESHHGYVVSEDWLIKTPGVVFALAAAVRAFTEPGEGVLLQLPVYYPFKEVIEDNGRVVVSNTLRLGADNRYHIDFEDFEAKIRENNIRLFFLCNPHNPVGRVWSREELERLGDICCRLGVVVVSDEIHADFAFRGKHLVFAGLKKEFEEITVTCTSPSKTFNLAGLQISNIFVANPRLREALRKQVAAAGYSQPNVLGITACQAAYLDGEEWYRAMLGYVGANIEFVRRFVEERLPGVTMTEHEGTYLVWLDFRGTGLDTEELEELIIHRAGLWLDSGKIFGESGRGFQRINAACPRAVLEEALERIARELRVVGESRKGGIFQKK